MYPIDSDVLALFQSGANQYARITMGNITIDNSRIIQSSLKINRYCSIGNTAMVGACIAAEANLSLENSDGHYNSTSFVGQELFIEIGVMDENEDMHYVPLGYFGIDEAPKKHTRINITALDRMLWFEQEPDESALTFPCTVTELLADICTECGVTRKISGALTNGSYTVDAYPKTARTYRDILSWICEITGTNAYFDYDGELVLSWYSTSSAVTLTDQNRITSDTSEESIVITGVEIQTEEETYLAGLSDYAIKISYNPLLKEGVQAVADAINLVVNRFTYKAFSATVLAMPHLYPMDGATFVDLNGNQFFVSITDWTFRINGNTYLRGRGESTKHASYVNPYGKSNYGLPDDEAIALMRANIIRTAEILNEKMDSVEQILHGEVTAVSSQLGAFQQETNNRIEANSEAITQNYSSVQTIIGSINEAITDTNTEVTEQGTALADTNEWRQVTEAYIKSGLLYYEGNVEVYGVAIGQLTYEEVNGKRVIKRDGFYATYTANGITIFKGTTEVAHFLDVEALIDQITARKIVMGNFVIDTTDGRFTIK